MGLFLVERDGARLAEVDANVRAVEWVLNGPGMLTFEVDPEDPRLANFRGTSEVEVQFWHDGELLWWGFPVGDRVAATGLAQVSCVSLEGYFDRRIIKSRLNLQGIEQQLCGTRLVEHAQSNSAQAGNADLGIHVAPWTSSGVFRHLTWEPDETVVVADALEDLSGMDDGFDWSVEVFDDGRREWTPYYPRRGELRDVLTWDGPYGARGIVDWSWTRDGQIVNEMIVTGDGEGSDRRLVSAYAAVRAARDGLSTHVESGRIASDDGSTLSARAWHLLRERRDPTPSMQLTVADTDVTDAVSIRPGDRFTLDVRRGFAAATGTWRVQQVTWRPQEQVSVLEVIPHEDA